MLYKTLFGVRQACCRFFFFRGQLSPTVKFCTRTIQENPSKLHHLVQANPFSSNTYEDPSQVFILKGLQDKLSLLESTLT